MITVAEIKKKSDRLYPKFLTSWLVGELFFPRVLKVDKNLSSDFSEMSKELAELFSESKDRKGFGYSIQSRSVKTRSHGIQDIPESIVFETQDDYLRFINKGKEFDQFIESSKHIKQSIVLDVS